MDLEIFKIDLKALPEGISTMGFDLDGDYFAEVGAEEPRRGSVHVDVEISRVSRVFTLRFHTEGTVVVGCDRCLADMDLPIEADDRIDAKLGEGNSGDDDFMTVDEDEGILDVAWIIYEFIALAIPVRHVHNPGECDPAMIRVLEQHSAIRSGVEGDGPVDPRWAALSKLKNDN